MEILQTQVAGKVSLAQKLVGAPPNSNFVVRIYSLPYPKRRLELLNFIRVYSGENYHLSYSTSIYIFERNSSTAF